MDTPKKTPNTLRGRFVTIVDGVYTVKSDKGYIWHIPKSLRHLHLKKGDFVFVENKGDKLLIVDKVYREDIEVTGKKYSHVRSKVDESLKIVLGGRAQESK